MGQRELIDAKDGRVHLTVGELNDMLENAAETGAIKALARVGLHDDRAPKDVGDLRELIASWREMKAEGRKKLIQLMFAMFILAALALGKTQLLKLLF